MFQTKVVEEIETVIVCSNMFSENRAVYKIMWENVAQPDRPHDSIVRAEKMDLWAG